MEDDVDDLQKVLKVTLIHDSKKYPVDISPSHNDEHQGTNEVLTVSHLATAAAGVTLVPQSGMKLIFKGQSLKDMEQRLDSLGIKNGAKIMVLGKKHDNLEVESLKSLWSIEVKVSETEKRLLGYIEEVDGVEKGYIPSELKQEALQKLSLRLRGTAEQFEKNLESLDGLSIDSSLKNSRQKRKSLVHRIQGLLDKTDKTLNKIKELEENK